MPRLQAKSFAKPDDVRSMPLMRVETISLDETQVAADAPPGGEASKTGVYVVRYNPTLMILASPLG